MNTNSSFKKIKIIQAESCPSLSGKTVIEYQVGCDANEDIFIRIVRTNGNGFFSKEWIKYDSISPILTGPLTASSLLALFQGKSINNSGFMLAVLKHLGLIHSIADSRRSYEFLESTGFTELTKNLITDGVDLGDIKDPTAGRKRIRSGKSNQKKIKGI